MKTRIALASILVLGLTLAVVGVAAADEPLADGDYSITLPDGNVIEFTISDEGDTVSVTTLPDGFSEKTHDDEASGESLRLEISDGTVKVQIKTGDDGKIEVDGLDLEAGDVLSAILPDALGVVSITLLGPDSSISPPVSVAVPAGWTVTGINGDDDSARILVSNGDLVFEVKVDLQDGSIEIKRGDDDDSSDEGSDAFGVDDESSDDAESDDAQSDDDDSSDEVDESTTTTSSTSTTSTSTTTTSTTSTTVPDDDDSSDDGSSDGDDSSS